MSDALRVVVVHDDGTVETKDIDQELRTMQTLVGDGEQVWIQAIEAGNVTFWCDEEIKFKPHNVNQTATHLCEAALQLNDRSLMVGDYLGGTVVITGGATPSGKTRSVPKSIEELLARD